MRSSRMQGFNSLGTIRDYARRFYNGIISPEAFRKGLIHELTNKANEDDLCELCIIIELDRQRGRI